MRCSARLRPRPAIRASRSGMIRASLNGRARVRGLGCQLCNGRRDRGGSDLPDLRREAGPLEHRAQRLGREEVTVVQTVGPWHWEVQLAARSRSRFGQRPASARREHAVRLRRERRHIGDVRQDGLGPDEVEGPVLERERVAMGVDDLDCVLQAGGGVQLHGEAAEPGRRFDCGHMGAEARGEYPRGPSDPGAEVEHALAGPQFGELRKRDGSGQAKGVALVHGDEVVDAQALGVQSRVAEGIADPAGELGPVVVGSRARAGRRARCRRRG